jgi:hypothetical protein
VDSGAAGKERWWCGFVDAMEAAEDRHLREEGAAEAAAAAAAGAATSARAWSVSTTAGAQTAAVRVVAWAARGGRWAVGGAIVVLATTAATISLVSTAWQN